MRPLMNARHLREIYEHKGSQETRRFLNEALEKKELRPEDFSIRALFEGLVPDGAEILAGWDHRRKGGGLPLFEAASAVDTSAFSSVNGQILYNKLLEGYTNPDLLWPECVESMNTVFLEAERIAGVGGVGDLAERVDEGQAYPTVGLNEEYVDFGKAYKSGFIIPITREEIVADRTGLVLKRAAEAGNYIGIGMEKRTLDIVTGQTNSYKRNGTSTNTYLTSGGYVNSQTGNTLTSWKSLESAELLFDAITDPNTGEPIVVAGEMVMIVPTALKMTALRILDVTNIGAVDNTAAATTVRQYGPNPIRAGSMIHATSVKVLSNAYVKNRTSSATMWFYGQPKKSFLRRVVWELENLEAPSNNEEQFTRDIWMRHKYSMMDMVGVQNPRYMTKNDT